MTFTSNRPSSESHTHHNCQWGQYSFPQGHTVDEVGKSMKILGDLNSPYIAEYMFNMKNV